jgi:hypothetical protein
VAVAVVLAVVLSGTGSSRGKGEPSASPTPGVSRSAPPKQNCSSTSPTGGASPGATVSRGPAAAKSVAFADEFDTLAVGPGQTWGYTTTAYAQGNRNPKDHKLDYTTPDALKVADGVLTITATPRHDHYWNTGLLTTEPSGTGGNGFRVRAGDFLVTHVRMPDGNTGGWPALWTWLGGDGEIDAFEWHSDNPHLLELSNRIRTAGTYYTNDQLVAPCRWVWIGIQLGSDDDVWYVGSDLRSMKAVFQDHNGIGDTTPYVIANLSVSDGTFHAAPSGSAAITYAMDSIRVYR